MNWKNEKSILSIYCSLNHKIWLTLKLKHFMILVVLTLVLRGKTSLTQDDACLNAEQRVVVIQKMGLYNKIRSFGVFLKCDGQ